MVSYRYQFLEKSQDFDEDLPMNSQDIYQNSCMSMESITSKISSENSESDLQSNNDSKNFIYYFTVFIKNCDILISIRVILSLTNDKIICSYICDSDECIKFILNCFYFCLYSQNWPLYQKNEVRSISENAIFNMFNFIGNSKNEKISSFSIEKIKCMNHCLNIRKDLIIIIGLFSRSISIQIENILSTSFANIHKNVINIGELLDKYPNSDLIFYGAMNLSFEIFKAVQLYFMNNLPSLSVNGPCSHLMLKMVEKVVSFFMVWFSDFITYKPHFNIQDDFFNFGVRCLAFFCNFKFINSLSCNCYALKKSDIHISNNEDILNIVEKCCSSLSGLISYLKNNIYDISFSFHDLEYAIKTLIEMLSNITMSKIEFAKNVLAVILNTFIEFIRLSDQYYNPKNISFKSFTDDKSKSTNISENKSFKNLKIFQNETLLTFVLKTLTLEFSSDYNCEKPSDINIDINHKICEKSLHILNYVLPYMKNNRSLVKAIVGYKFLERLALLVDNLNSLELLTLLCETIRLAIILGLRELLLNIEMISRLDALGTKFDKFPEFKILLNNLLYDLCHAENETLNNLEIQNMENSPNLGNINLKKNPVPWIKKDLKEIKNSFHSIKGVPPEEKVDSPFIKKKIEKNFEFRVKKEIDSPINKIKLSISDSSINMTEIDAKHCDTFKRVFRNKSMISPSNRMSMSYTNNKSILRRRDRMDGDNRSHNIFSYVANLFKSKRNKNRTQL